MDSSQTGSQGPPRRSQRVHNPPVPIDPLANAGKRKRPATDDEAEGDDSVEGENEEEYTTPQPKAVKKPAKKHATKAPKATSHRPRGNAAVDVEQVANDIMSSRSHAVLRLYKNAWNADYDKIFLKKTIDGKDWTVLDFYPALDTEMTGQCILIRDEYKTALCALEDYHWNGSTSTLLDSKYGAPAFVTLPYCKDVQPTPYQTTSNDADDDMDSEDIDIPTDSHCLARPEWTYPSWDKVPTLDHFAIAFCGHPGIGKTFLLYVLLALRFIARRPTWFIDRDEYYYFDNSGFEFFPNSLLAQGRFRSTTSAGGVREVWCLLNSDDPSERPNHQITSSHAGFLIQAASPRDFHTHWMKKCLVHAQALRFYLQPPSLDEFTAIFQLVDTLRRRSRDDVVDFYRKFGPSLREGLMYAGEGLPGWQKSIQQGIGKMSWDETFLYLQDINRAPLHSVSHNIMFVVAEPGFRTFSMCILGTEYLQDLLRIHASYNWEHKLNTVYQSFVGSPLLALAGWALSAGLHRMFSHPGLWELTQLEENVVQDTANRHWKVPSATHSITFTVAELTTVGNHASQFPSDDLMVYIFSALDNLDLTGHSGYYRPDSTAHPSFDAFIYNSSSRTAYALHATIRNIHSVAATDLRWLSRLPGVDTVIYIVVTSEPNIDLSFPVSHKYHTIDRHGKEKMSKTGIDTNTLVAERYLCRITSLEKGPSRVHININQVRFV